VTTDYALDVEAILAPGKTPEEPNWCPARAQVVCIVVQSVLDFMPTPSFSDSIPRPLTHSWWDSSLVNEFHLPGVTSAAGPSEKLLLDHFMGWFETNVRSLVTFNGRGFDLPCLIHRAVANGVKPSKKLLWMAQEPRYKPANHIDLRERFSFQGCFSKGTLQDYALAYGLPDPKAEVHGSGVGELVAARDGEKLVRYCLGDVETTKALWLRWQEATK
jgi:hypothetical protein